MREVLDSDLAGRSRPTLSLRGRRHLERVDNDKATNTTQCCTAWCLSPYRYRRVQGDGDPGDLTWGDCVQPGQNLTLRASFTAPSAPGTYFWEWVPTGPSGDFSTD